MTIPKIIAHRGASAVAPENTLSAFRMARGVGADGFETDVQLTRDGVPVIAHNYSIDAVSDVTTSPSQKREKSSSTSR